jgi:lipopolysaccharide export system permease protein
MRPNILFRYIRGQILLSSSFVLLAFLGLFAFFDFLAEIDRLLRPGVHVSGILLSIGLGLPARIYELAPLAALIGSVYTLAGLASSSQFTAMRSAGLTTSMALGMMLKTGAVIVLITVLVGEVVTPLAERVSVMLTNKDLGKGASDGKLRSGQWMRDSVFQDGRLHRVRFVNFRSYKDTEGISGLTVYELTPEHRMTRMLRAESATYNAAGNWTLNRVDVRVFDALDSGAPERLSLQRLPVMQWDSSLTPDLLSGLYIEPDKMSVVQLWRYQAFLLDNRQNTEKVQLALAKKTVYPLAILVMMVIALPFAYLHARAGGVSVKIFIGIMLGIGFYLLNNLFSHLNAVANMPPLLSASVPSLMALSGGLIGLWWVNRV